MRKRTYIWLGIVAIALAIGLVFGPARREEPPPPAAAIRDEPAAALDKPEVDDHAVGRPLQRILRPRHSRIPAQQASARLPSALPPSDVVQEQPDLPVAQANDKTFRSNASGRLVLDEHTRLNMEALFARTDRDRLADAKQQAIEPLPAAAAAQAAELLEQYDNYQQAQKQAYPPGVAPPTAEAALAELDGLHALREAHFGPVVARALYGAEETVSRQLIEQMRLEKDRNP